MSTTRSRYPQRFLAWLDLPQLGAFLLLPYSLYVLAWVVAVGVAVGTLLCGVIAFREDARNDGNCGHVQIDFGGQWLLARMLVEGHGRELYNRNYQREVLRAGYPVQDQTPNPRLSDAEQLMVWLMGEDNPKAARTTASFFAPLAAMDGLSCTASLALLQSEWNEEQLRQARVRPIGGPLYPPIHPLLHYPLGLLTPRTGYRVMQLVPILLGFVAGAGIRLLSRGRIWWPVASIGVMLYPGFAAAANLGQNPALTLTILIWGWFLLAREHETAGGAIWGLLAFKPVWATAFFLVLVLSGRWRACLAMLAGGAALALLTLPLVGVQSWYDWLEVGREGSLLYNVDENWIRGSRDLLSIPRRWLLDFQVPYKERDRDWLPPALIGWAMLLAVLEITVRVTVFRRDTARTSKGPAAAFLLLAAWLLCFHFMYYDVLLTVLPVTLLFLDWRSYLAPQLVALLPLPPSCSPRPLYSGGEGAGERGRKVQPPHPPPLAPEYGGEGSNSLDHTLGPDTLLYFEARRAATVPPPLSLLNMDRPRVWVLNRVVPTLVACVFLSMYIPGAFGRLADSTPPLDTYCLIALWLWCGWTWLAAGRPAG